MVRILSRSAQVFRLADGQAGVVPGAQAVSQDRFGLFFGIKDMAFLIPSVPGQLAAYRSPDGTV
jgi:hypothetical protein